MDARLNFVYELQKTIGDKSARLAKIRIAESIGTLTFRGAKVYQQLRQEYVSLLPTELSIDPDTTSLLLPAHVFWPAINNVLYLYNITVKTNLKYIEEFKFIFPESSLKMFKRDFHQIASPSRSKGYYTYSFQLALRKTSIEKQMIYFTTLSSTEQAEIRCKKQPTLLDVTISPHPVVFGHIPAPYMLDTVIKTKRGSISARFNSQNISMLDSYFTLIRMTLRQQSS